MRGGALPPALLCAALGFALAFAPRRALWPSLALLVAAAAAASFAPVTQPWPKAWTDAAFWGCWASVVAAAAAVHLPRAVWTGPWGERLALILALNSGVWGGLVIAAAGVKLDLLKSLPLALLALPGAWLVSKDRQIALKVVASWLIAVAILAASLPVTTVTPGYLPDHMD